MDKLTGARVGVFGDLMADLYVSGLSERVSREAPVLIVRYERQWLRPGGAANVATNAAALGAAVQVVGLVGDDEAGRQLLDELAVTGGGGRVGCEGVLQAPSRATITKTRFLVGAKLTSRQQVLRLDREPPEPPNKGFKKDLAEAVREVDRQVDAWVVSDYGYGSLDEGLRELFREIAVGKPVVADSRWDLHRFGGMTVLKPNEEEAEGAARGLGMSFEDVEGLAGGLRSRLEAQAVLVTLGNKGMVLAAEGEVTRVPAVGTEEIVDLTGAGDSVAATLAAGLAGGTDVLTAARLANHVGSIVVMKEGAATGSPDELRASIERYEARR